MLTLFSWLLWLAPTAMATEPVIVQDDSANFAPYYGGPDWVVTQGIATIYGPDTVLPSTVTWSCNFDHAVLSFGSPVRSDVAGVGGWARTVDFGVKTSTARTVSCSVLHNNVVVQSILCAIGIPTY